jgi:hypothetical protein
MGTDVARIVLTDEPFNVAVGGHVTGGDHREFVMASGEMTNEQFLEFNHSWMEAVLLPHRGRNPWHVHRLARPAYCSHGRNRPWISPA